MNKCLVALLADQWLVYINKLNDNEVKIATALECKY